MRTMRVLRSHRFLVVTAVATIGALGVWILARQSSSPNSAVVARVKRGPFVVTVTTAGELRAKKFVQVTAPPQLQQAGVYQIKIASLVPEGTVVKQGEQVAELDRSALASKLADVTLALQKAEAQYEQAQLDSALTLSGARESIRTMELGLEEKKLAKEEAVYEAPTVKRQAEIDYEKAERALAQAKTDYETKTEQARAKMREVGADLARQKNTLTVVQDVMAGCSVKAPTPGMVIYAKEWNGKKRTAGSQVSSWDPAVATLPDFTDMESVTYVNEIDVRKIAVGQPAVITLDADPSKRFSGTVSSVANVGEQRPSTDAKVFEVKVAVVQSDTTLRPGMTTGNAIETLKVPDALFVPLEAVSNEDSVALVYRLSGARATKQEVVTGAMNDDEVVVARGLAEGDRVLLTVPPGHEKLKLAPLPAADVAKPASVTAGSSTPPPTPAANQD
ncbi:MAG: RND transporter [Gemmatimonadetes bacterium]|nr:MAG: RND transporter [Gemmatimonadota bacterium]